MKRIFTLFILCSVVFCINAASAAMNDENTSVRMNLSTGNLIIRGTVQMAETYDETVILLYDGEEADDNNLIYINSLDISNDKSFTFKCELDNPIINGRYLIRQGENELLSGEIDTESEGIFEIDSVISYGDNYVSVYIRNSFADNGKYIPVVGLYDSNNRLINAKLFDEREVKFTDTEFKFDIAYSAWETTADIKLFLFESLSSIYPMSKAITINVNIDYEEIKLTAEKLFSIMDPEEEATKYIYEAYISGRYKEALDKYRNYFVDKVRTIDFGEFYQANLMYKGKSIDNAKLVAGTMTKEEYAAVYNTEPDMPAEVIIGDADNLASFNWVEYWDEHADYSMLPGSAMLTKNMVAQYFYERDITYLNKFLQLQAHYALNGMNQAETFMEEHNGVINQSNAGIYWGKSDGEWILNDAHQCALSISERIKNITYSLAAFSKFLTADTSGIENQYDFLKPVYEKVNDYKYDYIDSVKLAQICYSLVNEQMPYIYHIYCEKVRNAVPNQRWSGLTGIVQIGYVFNEFLPIKERSEQFNADYMEAIFDYQYKDGGLLEQSFNYNEGNIYERKKMIDFFDSVNASEMSSYLKPGCELWDRLAEGYSDPVGKLPQVGNLDNRGYLPVWTSAAVAAKYKENNNINEEDRGYTSVYFPYSGYAAMRSGWSMTKDIWLGYKNSFKSVGHKAGDNNSVWITAFGRQLIVSGQCPWYGNGATGWQNDEYEELNHYFDETSSLKCSTVIVNGQSQASTDKNNTAQTKTTDNVMDSLWLSDESFDYIEGIWDGGYFKTKDNIWNVKDMHTTHKRQVFYFKDAGMFAIVDTMNENAGNINSYRQIWGYPEYDGEKYFGFKDEQIIIDEDKNEVRTADEGNPNLWLMQFSMNPVIYHKYYGAKDTDLGVYIGWGGSTYGYNRIPKADIHIEWKNSRGEEKSQMITVAYPSRNSDIPYKSKTDLSNPDTGMSGFEITTWGNKKAVLMTSGVSDIKTWGDLHVNAESLLIYYDEALKLYKGIVLGAESFTVNEQEFEIPYNFEFSYQDGQLLSKEITKPVKFEWQLASNGITPVYK